MKILTSNNCCLYLHFFKGCQTSFPFVVRNDRNEEISEGTFQDRGNFSCTDGGEIFDTISYRNVSNLDTTCGADAKWTNYNSSWECWSG